LTNVACRAVCTLREHILKRTHSKERAKRSIVKLQAEPFNGLLFDGHALCDSHELLRHATFVRVTKEPSFDPSRTLSTLHELLAQASGPKGARSLSFSLSISLPPGRFVSVSTRGHVACERAVGEMSSSSPVARPQQRRWPVAPVAPVARRQQKRCPSQIFFLLRGPRAKKSSWKNGEIERVSSGNSS